MANSAPHEVIAAPFTVFWAPVGTAKPALHIDPLTVGFFKVGSSGPLNYDRGEGVTLVHRQSTAPWRSAGDTGVRKNFRTEEDQIVRLKLVDITLEQYRIALNFNPITSTAAASPALGTKKIGLSRGTDIATRALLVRGEVSPYQEEGVSQYFIPLAQEIGNPEVALSKPGEPAGLNLEFMALVNVDATTTDEYFGIFEAQDDTAVTEVIT